MEQSWDVSVVEEKEVRGDHTIKYFLPEGVRSTFYVSEELMVIEVPENEEISGGGRMEVEKKSVLPSVEERIGGT